MLRSCIYCIRGSWKRTEGNKFGSQSYIRGRGSWQTAIWTEISVVSGFSTSNKANDRPIFGFGYTGRASFEPPALSAWNVISKSQPYADSCRSSILLLCSSSATIVVTTTITTSSTSTNNNGRIRSPLSHIPTRQRRQDHQSHQSQKSR